MKPLTTLLLVAGLTAGLSLRAADAPSGASTNVSAPTPAPAVVPAAAAAAPAAPAAAAAAPDSPAPSANGLVLNFRGAPLSLVLDYFSDAAGFVINLNADVHGTVDVYSKEPVSKDEAVALLNSVLKKNGYGLTRNGRILTIFSQDNAKTADLEIVRGNNPDEVEKSDEVVTQIIPVQYASASQLVANLESLLPSGATLSVNESANSLILIATKSDIKRMLKIIQALDTSIASVSSIKVIPLEYADAKDTAALITQLFTPQASSSQSSGGSARANLFNMFGGPGGMGGMGGMFGGRRSGNGGSAASSSNRNGAAAVHVVAVGDDRSNSLVLSAPADLLGTIEEMVSKIDQPVTDVTEIRVFHLNNADPTETADQITQLFPDDTATTGNQNNVPFFMRMGGASRSASSAATDSQRSKKMGKVTAVADPRTASLLVTASKTLMPQVAEMITELDSARGRKEIVQVFELQNADPQDVYQTMQDLFNRTTTRANNNNSRSMTSQSANPLSTRQYNSATTAGSSSSSTSMRSSNSN